MMEKFNISGVEVFSAGTWNGDEYTKDDLGVMVQAFDENKSGFRPFLKLGHDEKQSLLQKDGLPSAGWVERLYIVGDKLMADFVDIPKKVYELIRVKAYRKVSAEIFWNLKVKDKTYKRLLGAVALLGSDVPGVMNLSDILSMYKFEGAEPPKIYSKNKEIDYDNLTILNERGEIMTKTENEIKLEYDLKVKNDEIEAEKARVQKLEEETASLKSEAETLRKFKIEAEAKEQRLLAEAETARIEKFVTEMKAEKLCSPAMEENMKLLLGEDKKEYTVKIDKEEKKLTKSELLKETFKLFKAAADVNFEESSSDEKKSYAKGNEEELDKLATEYAAKNKVSYGQALKAVTKEMKNK